MNSQIDEAVKVLRDGGIIIFPTDTAFGIGCLVNNEKAVQRLFEIRKRPQNKATPVLVSSVDMAKEYVKNLPQDVVDKLINPYWPGALTIVLNCQTEKVPALVRGGGETIGLRMPNHKDTLSIIEKSGVAILGPSANFHAEKTPYEFSDLNKELISLVDYVVTGDCLLKETSTVIDCSSTPWKILRKGAININI